MRYALRGFLCLVLFISVSSVESSDAQSKLNYGILANIESNPSDGSSNPHSFTDSAKGMYFLDRDGQLWFTDGTRQGTEKIPLKGSTPSSLQVQTPRSMVAFQDTIAFAASFTDPTGSAGCRQSSTTSPSCESQGLFVVNSDNSGVTLVREKIFIAESPAGKINEQRIVNIGQKLVFFGIESHDTESWWDSNSLWVSDGTRSGTFLLHTLDGGDLSVKQKISAGGRMYFAIFASQTFGGLWTSDGTVAGTVRISTNFAEDFRYHEGILFFRETIYQNYQYNYYLSRLDPIRSPSEISTRVELSSNVYSGLSFPLLYPSGNYIYFLERVNNYRDQLLALKRAKTSNLEISTVQQVQEPKSLTDFRGTLYFVATTDETGEELFRVKEGGYYGSPTVALASDVRLGRSGSSPASLTPVGDELFFSADGGDHGRELWKIRSQSSFAELAIDIYSGLNSSEPTNLTASANFLLMSAHNSTYGREPWVASRWELGELPVPKPTPPSSPGAADNSRSPRPEAYPYNASGRVRQTIKLKYAVYYQGSTSEEISVYRPNSRTKLFFVKTYYGDALSSGVMYHYPLNTRRLKRGRYTWCVNSFTESGRSGTAKCAGLALR